MFINGWGRNEQSSQRTCHRCFPPSFGSFGQTVSEEKNLKIQPIRKKNRLWWPCLLMDRDKLSNLYRGPPIDDTYQVSVYLAKRFQRRFFFNRTIRNKNRLWRPCLQMNRDDMSTRFFRGPSIDASYQVSIHLAKRFQWRFFRNRPIINNNCLWLPCLLTDIATKCAIVIEALP